MDMTAIPQREFHIQINSQLGSCNSVIEFGLLHLGYCTTNYLIHPLLRASSTRRRRSAAL